MKIKSISAEERSPPKHKQPNVKNITRRPNVNSFLKYKFAGVKFSNQKSKK